MYPRFFKLRAAKIFFADCELQGRGDVALGVDTSLPLALPLLQEMSLLIVNVYYCKLLTLIPRATFNQQKVSVSSITTWFSQ